jgi:uncharacterized protein
LEKMGKQKKQFNGAEIRRAMGPAVKKNRIFRRACAPILVAAFAVGGGLATGCESNKKDSYSERADSFQSSLKAEANVELAKAIINGNLKKVKKALENGADPDYGEEKGISLLAGACEAGKIKMVKELINHGANVNYSDGVYTPLLVAVECKHFKIAKTLIAHGADVNADITDGPILEMAAKNGDLKIVKLLVEKGAEIDAYSKKGPTPFLAAAENGKLKVVKYLYARGADTKAEHMGKNAITLAIDGGHYQTANFLIGITPKISGMEELKAAAKSGNLQLAKKLVDKGADFTSFFNVETPLMEAAGAGHVEMVQYLLNAPTFFNALNAKDKRGRTALMKGAHWGSHKVVRLLVKAGANLHIKDDSGKTALAHAEEGGKNETYDFLLSKGAKY